jgi:hypothetical protein
MEASDQAAPDPFRDVPADPLAEANEELPPGVLPGTLGGDNPSELEPVAGEPQPDEILVDPEESSTDGDAITSIPEESKPIEVSDEQEALPMDEEPEPVPEPQPETPVEGSTAGEESAPQPEPPAPEETTPKGTKTEAKSSKPKRKAKKSSGKKDTASVRGYVVLRAGENPGEWMEAFERPANNPDEPFVLEHRNGTTALRAAYRMLAEIEKEPQEFLLVCVPRKLWNPKLVQGRIHKQTAISIG